MNGHVDDGGRALVSVLIRPSDAAEYKDIEAWIDTGFNGELVLPRRQIEELALPQSGFVKAVLADGSRVALTTYSCLFQWFGAERHLEVVANEGEYPLLGVALLIGRDLHVSYRSGEVTIE